MMKNLLYILLALLCIAKVYGHYYMTNLKGDIDEFNEHVDDFIMRYQSKSETYYYLIDHYTKQDNSLNDSIRELTSEIYNLENYLLYRDDGKEIDDFSLLNFNLSKYPYSNQVFQEIGDSLNKIIELKINNRLKFYKFISTYLESYVSKLGDLQEQRNKIHRKAIISKTQQISKDSIHLDLHSIVYARDTFDGILWNIYKPQWFINEDSIEITEVPFKMGFRENYFDYSLTYYDGLIKRTKRYAPK